MPARTIADLLPRGEDALGDTILTLYGRKAPVYAVYRTAERVLVNFADDDTVAATQRKTFAPLNPVRGEITGLIDGWRCAPRGDRRYRRAERYDRRVGDALVVAFEGDVANADLLLKEVKQDIVNERVADACFQYLLTAFLVGLGADVVLLLVAAAVGDAAAPLWQAAAAGLAGSFFSIALGIKSRTILTDLHWVANIMDAMLRMVIGLIAAPVLMALVASKAVTIGIGDASLANNAWLYAAIIGFLAGFSERMVPDLLAKAVATPTTTTPPPPQQVDPLAAGTAPAEPVVKPATAAARVPPAPPPDGGDEDGDADHCVCDAPVGAAEATPDTALPPASGGVAAAAH